MGTPVDVLMLLTEVGEQGFWLKEMRQTADEFGSDLDCVTCTQ